MSRWAVLLLFLSVCKQGIRADASTLSDEARLEQDLFEHYDLEGRPVKDHTTTVHVRVRMNLKYFEVDDTKDTITIHCWMIMTWKDENLSWDPKLYGSIDHLQVDSEKLWQPELSLYNADITSQGSDARFYSKCLVRSSGFVICVPHVSHTALCAPDPRRWPYDVQNCTLRFGSWMHSGEQINFTLAQNVVTDDDYQENREWELKSVSISEHSAYLQDFEESYPSISYSFILKRRSATHAAVVIIPVLSLAFLTIACGLLAPGALRLGVALTSLLMQMMYLMEISWYVPSHGDKPAYIIMFFRDSVLITTIVILISMAMMFVIKLTRSPPRIVAILINFAKTDALKFVSFAEFDPNNLSPIVAEEGENNSRVEQERTANMEWQILATILSKLFSLIIASSYILLIFIYVLM